MRTEINLCDKCKLKVSQNICKRCKKDLCSQCERTLDIKLKMDNHDRLIYIILCQECSLILDNRFMVYHSDKRYEKERTAFYDTFPQVVWNEITKFESLMDL